MMRRFRSDTLPVTRWRNDGGDTREIASWPPGADADRFDWRISIATIDASGPFSIFPGVDRIMLLLGGDGIELQGSGIDERLVERHGRLGFDGEAVVECNLLGTRTRLLNVMCRRHRIKAEVSVRTEAGSLEQAHPALLLVLDGSWQAGDHRIEEDEGLWWIQAVPKISLTPGEPVRAALACVLFHVVAPRPQARR